ncbi:MAG: hypothetical protein KC492_23665, partial [Myxococcales bacterium]|nr:hypothetical protein [Myxococcales bacterium]
VLLPPRAWLAGATPRVFRHAAPPKPCSTPRLGAGHGELAGPRRLRAAGGDPSAALARPE